MLDIFPSEVSANSKSEQCTIGGAAANRKRDLAVTMEGWTNHSARRIRVEARARVGCCLLQIIFLEQNIMRDLVMRCGENRNSVKGPKTNNT